MNKIESGITEKIKSITPFIPKELAAFVSSRNMEPFKYILPRFNAGNLPFNFKLNARGGWVSPNGDWYIPSITANVDDILRPRLTNAIETRFFRQQALQEGWIRIDWFQPIFNNKFSLNDQSLRKFIISVDGNRKINQKMFRAIQAIAMLYTVILPKNFFYEIRKSKEYLEDGKILYTVEKFRGFEFFNLGLNTLRV